MKQRILVADDEPDIRNLIAIYLQAEGFLVDQVSNGKEALEALKKNQYELVLLDIMMPVTDGIETLLRIRQEYTMPVIFLTAKSTELDMIQGLTLGADDSGSTFVITLDMKPQHLVISFTNACDSIKEEDVDRLFDRFYHQDEARQKEGSLSLIHI